MSKIYDAIVTKAADELKAAMYEGARRGSYGMPTVYAIPTTEDADGTVVVVPYGGEAPARGVEIKPNANHASQHTSWLTTPYDHVRSILWQALHNQPILPRERPPTGPHVVRVVQSGVGHGRKDFSVFLNGDFVSTLHWDLRSKAYEGDLPQHDGKPRRVSKKSIKALEAEVVQINLSAKEAGRI